MSPYLTTGVFFAFEGIDGAGKTTQAVRLARRLNNQGLAVTAVKEPTDGPWGRRIREIAQNGREHVTLDEELRFFIQDRQQDVDENIGPALARGEVVIADRYFYSNIAYQSALGASAETIRRLNAGFPVPDLVFVLEITTALSQVRITRIREEKANLGYEQEEYLTLVKKVFDDLRDPNLVRLDGDQDIDTLAEEIWKHARPVVEARLR